LKLLEVARKSDVFIRCKKKYERKGDIAHKNLSITRKGTDREHLLEFNSFCSEEFLQYFLLKCLHMRSVSTTRDELFITLLVMFADSIIIIIAVIIALMSGDIK